MAFIIMDLAPSFYVKIYFNYLRQHTQVIHKIIKHKIGKIDKIKNPIKLSNGLHAFIQKTYIGYIVSFVRLYTI